MVTALIARGYVQGAGICMIGWLVCAAVYLIVCFAFRRNRKNPQSVILAFLAAEFVVDLIWAAVYFGSDGYTNLGLRGAWWMALWPIALVAAGLLPAAVKRKARG